MKKSKSCIGGHHHLHFQWGQKWAIREGSWKLLGFDNKPDLQLLNLDDEQPERTDYAKQKADLVARLKDLHNEWAAEVATPSSGNRR